VNGPDPADDTYVFFQHNATITVGDNVWARTEFDIGGDDNWSVILANPGNTTTPSDLYIDPQQWGFVLDHDFLPEGVQLGFDQLEVVPEPSGLVLMSLAMLGLALCGWCCRARSDRR